MNIKKYYLGFIVIILFLGCFKTAFSRDFDMCISPYRSDALYSGKFISSVYKSRLTPGELFKIKIYILNTGNVTWFGDKSLCDNQPFFRLGTNKLKDRLSIIWPNIFHFSDTQLEFNWLSGNRIKMNQEVVPPGQIATFEFYSIAPYENDVYMEYFSPLFEGMMWLDNISIPIQLNVGDIEEEKRGYIPFMNISTSLKDLDLDQKSILVDISDQKMYVKAGDRILYTFPVSTGAYDTPTPLGKTKIYFKQDVRVGAKPPHYIMPKYLAFRSNGAYAIHALPSLRFDGGSFWQEAFDHIGSRRSHGCIRLLPEHADIVFDFTDIGTPVEVVL